MSAIDILTKQVKDLALKAYPELMGKDIDGTWYDFNETKRIAYSIGALEIIGIIAKGLEARK